MPPRKLNCWEDRQCGREPGGARVAELGPCPAATDAMCDGINEGQCAGRFCWAVGGTFCEDVIQGTHAQKLGSCERCHFYRRVKYEQGAAFQLLRPGMGTSDPAELHRQLNHVVELLSICRDIFACLALRPLLVRLAAHALAVTRSSSAAVYLVAPSQEELVLEAHAGSVARPERVGRDAECPVAEAAREGCYCQSEVAGPRGAGILPADSRLAGGTPAPLHVAAIPVGGEDGLIGAIELLKPEGFSPDDEWFIRELGIMAGLGIGNARQVEELRQLKRFDKAKSRFVAVLMHHIGSPLATIACSLQALAQLGDSLTPGDREKLIGVSLDRIGSIQTLSRRLLDLAAIRNGTSLAAIRPVDPAEPLRQEVDARIATARQKGVELVLTDDTGTSSFSGDLRETGPEPEGSARAAAHPTSGHGKSRMSPFLVMADPDGLRVLFANLLDNAIKYSTQPGKRVDVSLSVGPGSVRISVRDQGIGIPRDEQARIFEEFHRASNAATSKVAGFGLGLAIVKELVDRFGGAIQLESAVGVGTTFSVEFPIASVASPK